MVVHFGHITANCFKKKTFLVGEFNVHRIFQWHCKSKDENNFSVMCILKKYLIVKINIEIVSCLK